MSIKKLLIANRGEVAIRIADAAAELGIATVSVHAEDDVNSLHVLSTDENAKLQGRGASAYLSISAMIDIAQEMNCDAIHPGYGFLSENADFAEACEANGLIFVGPRSETLQLFAKKSSAKQLARAAGVPVGDGADEEVSLKQAKAYFRSLEPGTAMIIKAVAGGGGKGIRIVDKASQIGDAYEACRTEALSAFGYDGVIVETFLKMARHIEVQIVADADGEIVHLAERECSLQRRHQKVVEIAPCPDLSATMRKRLTSAAIELARRAGYCGVGTFEFLVDGADLKSNPEDARFVFLEANPRLQVEHTITEEITGIDIVQLQLRIASGESLRKIGVRSVTKPNGNAIQLRINLEQMDEDGVPRGTSGAIDRYEMPSGKGIRVDGYGYSGYRNNPRYDPLIAKLIIHTNDSDLKACVAKARRALSRLEISGVASNHGFLTALLARPEISTACFHTKFVDEVMSELVAEARHLAVSANSKSSGLLDGALDRELFMTETAETVIAPMQGVISEVLTAVGDHVVEGQAIASLEAMKMTHAINAPVTGVIIDMSAQPDLLVEENAPIFVIEPDPHAAETSKQGSKKHDLDLIRPELESLRARRALILDEARPNAIEKRRRKGQRTARENIDDLCDDGTFKEYGDFVVAAQRSRRTERDLTQNTPADGLISGVGLVNGEAFGAEKAQCAVVSYDYTVLAGTQGHFGHKKKDRIFEIAARRKLPVILFSEGGGGRPGDTDILMAAGIDIPSFSLFAELSGKVPLIGINSGRCFAGNAALLGCCDVIIATSNSSIGMGGPAMIEGGGLGSFTADEIGPLSVQVPNGVVDIAVEDEAEAVSIAKTYLSFFQGSLNEWTTDDQRRLRVIIPENRRRSYDVRDVITCLVDDGSLLELRTAYGMGIVTAFARMKGRSIGVIANNPIYLGGAIDAVAADKASRFMQLCDAFSIPILSLCDTPGFMVGPQSETTATVRRFARMFVTAAGMRTPMITIVLRKAYGLGAMAMFGGNSRKPLVSASWPSGEFGPMGLEGAVKLGFRKELSAIPDDQARQQFFEEKVAEAHAVGAATNAASLLEIDTVIDPIETRDLIGSALAKLAPAGVQSSPHRAHIDTW